MGADGSTGVLSEVVDWQMGWGSRQFSNPL